jgi:hypothetical protein
LRMVRAAAIMGGTLIGLVVGAVAADRLGEQFREDLFNPRPIRRLAALGFLARHSRMETVGLLRDYLVWEQHALLRRRAVSLLKRLEARYA